MVDGFEELRGIGLQARIGIKVVKVHGTSDLELKKKTWFTCSPFTKASDVRHLHS